MLSNQTFLITTAKTKRLGKDHHGCQLSGSFTYGAG